MIKVFKILSVCTLALFAIVLFTNYPKQKLKPEVKLQIKQSEFTKRALSSDQTKTLQLLSAFNYEKALEAGTKILTLNKTNSSKKKVIF